MDYAASTIGALVAEDYRLATVFKKYGIDFCCGGGRTVQDACARRGIDLGELAQALDAARQAPPEALQPTTWALDFLADYIVHVHHRYVRESLPPLLEWARKVARVHGGAEPELVEIAAHVEEVAAELLEHMAKEEVVLFPHVRALVAAQRAQQAADRPAFGTVRNPVRMMEHEHDQAGETLRAIRRLSRDFTPPPHACNTYRVLFAKLAEFEADLHRHVHLENNILFPKAVVLEQELQALQPA